MTEAACPARWATSRSPDRETHGGAAAKVARLFGHRLLPWQRQVLDVVLELGEDGEYVYTDAHCGTPRQNGKTFFVIVAMTTRALLFPGSHIVYGAQSALDARRKLVDDWLPMIQASKLAPLISAYQAPGRESLRFTNGSVIQIMASTKTSLHGAVVSAGVLDEIFSAPDARMEQALRPAMVTQSSAQLLTVSTAGTVAASPYLWDRLQRGRQAVDADLRSGFAFFEWSAPDDADPADPEVWRAAAPALGYTIDEKAIESAYRAMPRHEFMRAYLNMWTLNMGEPVIPLALWDELVDMDSPRPDDVVLAVDIAPGSKSAAIVAAGECDGVIYVTVLEHGSGSDWVLPTLNRLTAALRPSEVIFDQRAAGPLLTAYDGARVAETTGTNMVDACTFFVDLAMNRRLRHRGEPELTIALDGAAKRSLGDGFAWTHRGSGADLTPLVAVSLACWAFYGSYKAREEAE